MILLPRSASDRILLGVCGGIAQRLAVHASWFRLAFVVAALASGVGVVIYLLLALVMPPPGAPLATVGQRMRYNLLELRLVGQRSASAFERWRLQRELAGEPEGVRTAIGIAAVLGGLFVLLWSFGLFWWLDAWRTVGLVIALIGLALLMPKRTSTSRAPVGARAPLLVIALVVLFGVVFAGAGVKALDDSDDTTTTAVSPVVIEAMRLADRQRIAELETRLQRLESPPR